MRLKIIFMIASLQAMSAFSQHTQITLGSHRGDLITPKDREVPTSGREASATFHYGFGMYGAVSGGLRFSRSQFEMSFDDTSGKWVIHSILPEFAVSIPVGVVQIYSNLGYVAWSEAKLSMQSQYQASTISTEAEYNYSGSHFNLGIGFALAPKVRILTEYRQAILAKLAYKRAKRSDGEVTPGQAAPITYQNQAVRLGVEFIF